MRNSTIKSITFYFIVASIAVITFVNCEGTNSTVSNTDDSKLKEDWSYCFEFTWFGPNYDNYTRYNGSCADYIDDSRDDHVACSPPVVITEDGTPPDIDYLWEHHKSSVVCRQTVNKVCAKYTFFYNGQIENATYMCTKVQAVDEGVITSGCYTQKVDGYDVELCVCESSPGIKYKPCNSAATTTVSLLLFLLPIVLLILNPIE